MCLVENSICCVVVCVFVHAEQEYSITDNGWSRAYDLWNASPMLCQLSEGATYYNTMCKMK